MYYSVHACMCNIRIIPGSNLNSHRNTLLLVVRQAEQARLVGIVIQLNQLTPPPIYTVYFLLNQEYGALPLCSLV